METTVIPAPFWEELLGSIPDAITIVDGDGEFLYANDLAAQLCGFDSADELLRAGAAETNRRFEILDEIGLPSTLQVLPGRQVLAGSPSPHDAVVRYRDVRTREERWSRLNSRSVVLPGSTDAVAINVFNDVTEQIRTEQALAFLAEGSELLAQSLDYDTALRSLASLAVPKMADWCTVDMIQPDGSVVSTAVAHSDPAKVALARDLQRRLPFDPDGQGGVAEVLRSGEPQLIAEITDEMLVAANLQPDILEILRELGLSSSMTVPLKVRDRVLGAITFVAAESGRHFGAAELTLAGDLARRAALAVENASLFREAERTSAELRGILLQMTDAVIVADAGGIVTFANDAAHAMFGGVELGLPAQGSRPHSTYATLEGVPLLPEEMALTRACGGETVMDFFWRVRRPDQSELILETSAVPLFGEDGEPLGAVTVSHDITLQHEFDRQKDSFLLAASHDLKNPLTLVKGTAQLLEQRSLRPDARIDDTHLDGLRRIGATASRMADMINEMLDVSRLRMGRPLALDLEPTDLCAIIRIAVEQATASSERNPIEFICTQAQLVVQVDALRIERVAQNLLSNAAKFSPEAGPIRVTLEAEGDTWAVLTVSDHGVGIPPSELSLVFEQFHRGTNVAATIQGSGIGLSGVKQIVEQHGGSIGVASKVGKGSTFTVRLPLIRRSGEKSIYDS